MNIFPEIKMVYSVNVKRTDMVGEFYNIVNKRKKISSKDFNTFEEANEYANLKAVEYGNECNVYLPDAHKYVNKGECGIVVADTRDNEVWIMYTISIKAKFAD